MKRLILLLILAILLLLTACETTSGPRFRGEVYSVSALLLAGSPIDTAHPVYLTRSSDIDSFDYMELFVPDATITIFELSESDTTAILNLTPVLDLGMEDPTPMPKIKYIDPSAYLIQPGKTYAIQINVPGYAKTITAQTTVPATVTPDEDLYNYNIPGEGYSTDPAVPDSTVFDTLDDRYPLALNTGNYTGKLKMFAEIYCLEPFSTDLEWTIPLFGITHADSSLAWIYNSSGNSMRRISFFSEYLSRYVPEADGNYAVLSDFGQSIAFFGRYRFTIYSIDDNYYNYSYQTDGYLHGGIHNALGYFGSASGGVLFTKVIKAPPGSSR
ncbi:MAG TPA: DUF4249 family protein [Candidatus Cloacimonadota bacterium]|nr:DUF4249 family protein [Candidatus Cloacimonadota bacterium]HPS39907.1 DUF4249 family protein [Candidatus Cloacimonadota bacterium]